MSEIDPQLFFHVKENQYLDKLVYEPRNVDVLEIIHLEDGQLKTEPRSLNPDELGKWLDRPLKPHPEVNSTVVRGALRLILGGSATRTSSPESHPLSFPDDIHNIVSPQRLPFSRSHFKLVIDKFGLPKATPWLFQTCTGHFQRYRLQIEPTPSAGPVNSPANLEDPIFARTSNEISTGITLRRTSRGVLAIDLALSLTHNHKTGITHALLLGHSERQGSFMKQQIQDLAQIAHHPAFLPTLICTYHRTLLQRLSDKARTELFNVESASGQTTAPIGRLDPRDKNSGSEITKRVLGVIQQATAWKEYTTAMLFDVESVQKFVGHLNSITPANRKSLVRAEGEILDERLRFLAYKGKSILWKLQHVLERAQAQQNAIYNYIAVKNNTVNRNLAYDSRELAVAAKRDSYAMKSISLITMVFLPGTFVATLFATPAIQQASPRQWVYWLVTVLLTLSVLVCWASWYRWTLTQVDAEPSTRPGTSNTFGPASKEIQSRLALEDPMFR